MTATIPGPRTAAVIGAQFGDEGKGKVVDALAPDYDIVVRFQGGNNAGHTLVVGGQKTVLHQVPSGVLHPGMRCAIGAGCVVDPLGLVSELDTLTERAIDVDARLTVAGNAALILPVHRALDGARENAAGRSMIGTTRRGIGPTYEDRAARRSVLAADLLDTDRLVARLNALLPARNLELRALDASMTTVEETLEALRPAAERLKPCVGDVAMDIHDTLARGGGVLFEGAQGCMLDTTFGTMPFVTSSHTGLGAVAIGAGLAPAALGRTVGVVKAYQTRVGAGPMPTEQTEGPILDHLRTVGAEFGATTGRPRRCGWIDLPLLRYVCALNGFGEIALTKLDVLAGLDPIRLCVAYRIDGLDVQRLGPWQLDRMNITPVYAEMPGFDEDLTGVRTWGALPVSARRYVERLEAEMGVAVRTVSVGPGRLQQIERGDRR